MGQQVRSKGTARKPFITTSCTHASPAVQIVFCNKIIRPRFFIAVIVERENTLRYVVRLLRCNPDIIFPYLTDMSLIIGFILECYNRLQK